MDKCLGHNTQLNNNYYYYYEEINIVNAITSDLTATRGMCSNSKIKNIALNTVK